MKANDSKLKKLRAEAPEYWKQVAKFIEVKPQKTAVTVTTIIGEEDVV
jgi:DNA-binding XRE family transcriptional regulator